MEKYGFLEAYFIESGISENTAHFLSLGINIFLLLIGVLLVFYISRKAIVKTFSVFSGKTKTNFDDFLLQSKFPEYVSNIPPLFLLISAVPFIFSEYPMFLNIFENIIDIYIILLTVMIVRSIVRSLIKYLKTFERLKDKPLDSFTQVIMIFVWLIALVFIFSELTGKSVIEFLVTLGAASAVILLIFKDSILGFVASIQVSVNDIVRIGDWITFSKYGADGDVIEINLATVKVQNWDKTITTIPTYSLISDAFQNWRGMQESPGRRIKRSLFIKQNSIKFVDVEDLKKYEKFSLIGGYLKERQKEIDHFNKQHNFDRSAILNGRNQTNLGIFRKYANEYLKEHPMVSKELTIMVRHLAPTPHGIPLEVYCFITDKRWVYYEEIYADIFDHLIAAIPYFDLKLFEEPAGDDILKISEHFSAKEQNPPQ